MSKTIVVHVHPDPQLAMSLARVEKLLEGVMSVLTDIQTAQAAASQKLDVAAQKMQLLLDLNAGAIPALDAQAILLQEQENLAKATALAEVVIP